MLRVIRHFPRVLVLLLALLLMSGCAGKTEQFVHTPSLSQGLSRIIEGKTTRQEVIQYIGEPDTVADGTTTTVRPGGTLWRFHTFLYRKRDEIVGLVARSWISIGDTTIRFDPEEWKRLQPYSSVDERFLAFVYWEMRSTGSVAAVPIGAVVQNTARQNRLLIFINKEIDIVDIMSYREEFKVN